jgi:pilus assembly protein Flp/PilA
VLDRHSGRTTPFAQGRCRIGFINRGDAFPASAVDAHCARSKGSTHQPGGAQVAGQAQAERGERGASAVEYSLLVVLIAAVVVIVVTALGGQVNDLFDSLTGLF